MSEGHDEAHPVNVSSALPTANQLIQSRTMQAEFTILPLSAAEVFEGFGKVVSDIWPKNVQSAHWNQPLVSGSAAFNCTAKDLSANANWKSALEQMRKTSSLRCSSMQLQLDDGWRFEYHDPDNGQAPYIQIHIQDSYQSTADRVALAAAIGKRFKILSKFEARATGLQKNEVATLEFAQSIVASLSAETANISRETAKSLDHFVEAMKERTLELERKFTDRTHALEDEFRSKDKELEQRAAARIEEIETREKKLAEEMQKFEMRNNTAVRRDLLRELKQQIAMQKSVEITPETVRKRRVIHLICIGVLLVSGTIASLLIRNVLTWTDRLDWRMLLPLTTWTAFFIATVVYYIRWTDQWFRDHARVEFQNRKFASDILRASWVAELFFEWKEQKGANMPEELVASFTRHLFEHPGMEGKLHPADQISDLMKEVSSLKVGKGAFEITKDKKAD